MKFLISYSHILLFIVINQFFIFIIYLLYQGILFLLAIILSLKYNHFRQGESMFSFCFSRNMRNYLPVLYFIKTIKCFRRITLRHQDNQFSSYFNIVFNIFRHLNPSLLKSKYSNMWIINHNHIEVLVQFIGLE